MTGFGKHLSAHQHCGVNQLARLCHDLNIDLGKLIGSIDQTLPIPFIPAWTCASAYISSTPTIFPPYARKLGYPFRPVGPGEEINTLPADLARRQDLPNRNSKAVRGSLMPTPISAPKPQEGMA
jgi:hypothetical protein